MAEHRVFELPGSGLRCQAPGCGAVLPRVNRTVTTDGFVTRERICPVCGQINTTSERVINARERRSYVSERME